MQKDQSRSVSPITHLYLVFKNNIGMGWGRGLADSLNPDLRSVCIRIVKYRRKTIIK